MCSVMYKKKSVTKLVPYYEFELVVESPVIHRTLFCSVEVKIKQSCLQCNIRADASNKT